MKIKSTFFICLLIAVPLQGRAMSLINQMDFGDGRNSCFLPFSGNNSGKVVWAKTCSLGTPRNLTLYNNLLVIQSRGGVEVRSAADGSHLWHAQSSFDHGFFCAEENVFSVYSKIDSSNSSINNTIRYYSSTGCRFYNYADGACNPILFDFTGDDINLLYFSRIKGRTLYFYKSSPPVNSGGNAGSEPVWRLCRYDASSSKSICIRTVTSMIDQFAVTDDRNHFYLLSYGKLYRYSTETCGQDMGKPLPIPSVTSFSLNAQGNIIALVNDSGANAVLRFNTIDGKKSAIPLPKQRMLSLPPAISTSGIVVCVSSTAVHALSERSVLWSHLFPGKTNNAFITLLGDSTVLVAADSLLSRISSKGKIVFTRNVQEQITCRPIMDTKGSIYIGTERKILLIK